MKKSLSLLLIASLSACTLADFYPEVSRAGKNIKFLVQVSTAGASTPSTNFNKTKDPSDDLKITDFLTPLG